MPITSNAALGLLYVANGSVTARWNFPETVGHRADSLFGIGEDVDIRYSFPTSAPSYYGFVNGFQKFSNEQKAATRDVLASIEEIIDVDFKETSALGQMTFANSPQPPGQAGFAYSPNYSYMFSGSRVQSVTEGPAAGDVWINRNEAWSRADWQEGGDGYLTLLHEVGHALGLKHPFDGNYRVAAALDSEQYTVMSYTQAPHSTLIEVTGSRNHYSWQQSSLRPSTLMPMDIDALQYLYGANTSTRSGSTNYKWDTNEELLETIWDGGGKDTIDCSNQVFSNVINLEGSTFSSIALRQTAAEIRTGLGLPSWFTQALPSHTYDGSNNLAIARGVVIENAIGGSAADRITGNAAANTLTGNAGNDVLSGLVGNDVLSGNDGSDMLSGGTGDDRLVGGTGRDTLTGGTGRDIFDFNSLGEMSTLRTAWDIVTDFMRGQDDIDLSTIDARSGGGNDAFRFIGSAAFSANASGQLRYVYEGARGYGVLYGSTDADSAAEFALQINGVTSLSSSDFIA